MSTLNDICLNEYVKAFYINGLPESPSEAAMLWRSGIAHTQRTKLNKAIKVMIHLTAEYYFIVVVLSLLLAHIEVVRGICKGVFCYSYAMYFPASYVLFDCWRLRLLIFLLVKNFSAGNIWRSFQKIIKVRWLLEVQ